MSKIVKILIIVAVVALVIVSHGTLAPFLNGLLGLAATSMVGGILASALVGLAVSSLMSLLAPTPKSVSQSLFDRLNLTVDPTAPRRIVFGKTAAGADIRFHETGPPSTNGGMTGVTAKGDWLYQIIALASHKVNSVQSVTLEDVLSYSGGSNTGTYSAQGGLFIKPVTEGTSSNGFALASGGYWQSTSTFTGCAYLAIAMKDDSKIYANGIPARITTIVEGCPVYDPRLDSTAGGSGSMRAADQTTWAYYNGSDEIGRNPALCLLTYLLGYRINGVIAWGMGVPASRIDLANFITYANVCDETISDKLGSSIKRYQCDGIFSTADNHQSVIDAIALSMGTTKLVDAEGLYSCVGGYDDLSSPIVEFGPDEIVSKGYQWKPAPPSKDRHTRILGRFADPANLYQLNAYPEVDTGNLADDIPRPLTVDFNCVARPDSCQRIAKQMLAREAFPGVFAATFGPTAFAVSIGSLVYLTLPQEGWNRKLFRVIDQSESADLIFSMTLAEEDSAIYAWDADEAIDLPAVIRPPGYNPSATETVAGLTGTARTITNSTGGKDSYIDLSWTAPDTTPAYIEIQARETGGTIWTTQTDRTVAGTLAFTFRAVSSGLSTDIQARYIMQSGVHGPWSPTTVTAAVGTGANAVVGYLTNESVTFAADTSGNIL